MNNYLGGDLVSRVDSMGFTLGLNFWAWKIGEGVAGKGKRDKRAWMLGTREIES